MNDDTLTLNEGHNWDGCICKVCNGINYRSDKHNWNGCTCLKCGLVRVSNHKFPAKSCKCTICGGILHDFKSNLVLDIEYTKKSGANHAVTTEFAKGTTYYTCQRCGYKESKEYLTWGGD